MGRSSPRLKIVVVAHGQKPVPPDGHGAVENVIWQLDQRMRARGHRTSIVNTRQRYTHLAVLARIVRMGGVDFVHCHSQLHVPLMIVLGRVLGFRVVFTCHDWDLDVDAFPPAWLRLMRSAARAPFLLSITPRSEALLRSLGARGFHAVLPNGTEVRHFALAEQGDLDAVCVARIEPRKRQLEVAGVLRDGAVRCDFIGPDPDGGFHPDGAARFIGPRSREDLHAGLTRYRAHVLLSSAEGQPLVVTEALAAGLSVVVSPEAAENLDVGQPFVHVVDDVADLPQVLATAVAENHRHRRAIRAYAERTFDYDVLVGRYEEVLRGWRAASDRRGRRRARTRGGAS